jgi:vacuolar-type H+-ATPase subunit E/Vma4
LISHFAGFLHQNPGARRVWEVRENRLKSFRQAVVEELTEGINEFDYTNMVIEALEKLDQAAKQ